MLRGAKTLALWRARAAQVCWKAGWYKSCDLCKRCIKFEHRFGRVELRNALAWRSPAKRRFICHTCYLVLSSVIEELESNGSRENLPPEDVLEVTEEELAKRVSANSIYEERRAAKREIYRARNGRKDP